MRVAAMANDLPDVKAPAGGNRSANGASLSVAPPSAPSPSLSSPSAREVALPPTSPSSRRPKQIEATDEAPTLAVPALTAVINSERRRTQSAGELRAVHSVKLLDPPSSPSNAHAQRSNSLFAMGSSFIAGLTGSNPSSPTNSRDPAFTIEVVYKEPGPLFVDLVSRGDGKGAYVKSFRRPPDGVAGAAEADGRVGPEDELYAINGLVVTDFSFGDIIQAAKRATFPLTLTFHCGPDDKLSNYSNDGARRRQSSSQQEPGAGGATVNSEDAAGPKVKRSNSFDHKSNPPASPSRQQNGVEAPMGAGKTAFRAPWGDGISLDKVRHTGTDGMKSLFRKIGAGGKTRPEEDPATVSSWLEHLELKPQKTANGARGGRISYRKPATPTEPQDILHTTPIIAVTTGGRFVGVLDGDDNEFALTWYRKTPPPASDVLLIKGVRRAPYFPSADDIGAIISLQVRSLRFPQLVKMAELPQPLVLDPAVGEMVDVMLETGAGAFSATLASNEFDSFQIKITSEGVTLLKISEHEDEAGVVVNATYTEHVQVLLDPSDQLRFTLKVQEFGGFLGNKQGDTCDLKRRKDALSLLSCFFLVAQNPQHRDILALLIRKFRARTIGDELDERAQADERNLFVDPAFDATVTVSRSDSSSPATGAGLSPAGQSPSPAHSMPSPVPNGDSGTFSGAAGASPGRALVSGKSGAVPPPSKFGASPPPPPSSSTTTTPSGSSLDKTGSFRSVGDVSSPSVSEQLGDMFSLDLEDSQPGAKSNGITPAGTPHHAKNAGELKAPDAFLQGRVASQEKEIQMLRDKLASMSVMLKSVDQEKSQFEASLEVKDKRVELQQLKIRQLEKVASQYTAQTRDLQQLRAKLKEDELKHVACQLELEQARAAAAERTQAMCTQETQTEEHLFSSADAGQFDAFFGVATVSVDDLQRRIASQDEAIARADNELITAIAERNALRQKAGELSKELKKLLGANRSLADIESQLIERANLAMELAIAKAELKRATDEASEFKDALELLRKQRGMGDKEKDTQRVLSQNLDLQRTVHELTDSLNESREQLVATKAINSALVQRLQQLQPDARGSLFESPLGSPQSVQSAQLEATFSDDDYEDDEEKEEHQEGIAAFRRSLV